MIRSEDQQIEQSSFDFTYVGALSASSSYFHIQAELGLETTAQQIAIFCSLSKAVGDHFSEHFMSQHVVGGHINYVDNYSKYVERLVAQCRDLESRFLGIWAMTSSTEEQFTGRSYLKSFSAVLNDYLHTTFSETTNAFYNSFVKHKTNLTAESHDYEDLIYAISGEHSFTYQHFLDKKDLDGSFTFPKLTKRPGEIKNNIGKRSLGGVFKVVLSAVSSLIGLGSGLYSLQEVERLGVEINGIKNEQNLLFERTRLTHAKISEIEGKLSDLFQVVNGTLYNIDNINTAVRFNLFFTEAEEFIMNLRSELVGHEISLTQLANHRISPSLISQTSIFQIFESAKQQALERNLLLFSQNPLSILQAPISSLSINGRVVVIIHLPLKTTSRHFDVFEFSSKPVLLNGMIFRIKQEKTILVANSDRSLYKLMKKEDLRACSKFPSKELGSDVFHCNHPAIYKRNLNEACLPRLLLGKVHDLNKYCNVLVSNEVESVEQIRSNEFRVISANKSIPIDITCKVGDTEHFRIQGVEKVHIDSSCSGVTPQTVFLGSSNFILTSNRTVKVPVTAKHLLQVLNYEELDHDHLKDILSKNRLAHPTKEIDLTQFKELYEKERFAPHSFLYRHRSEIILAILLLLILLFITIYCGFCKTCRLQKRRREMMQWLEARQNLVPNQEPTIIRPQTDRNQRRDPTPDRGRAQSTDSATRRPFLANVPF